MFQIGFAACVNKSSNLINSAFVVCERERGSELGPLLNHIHSGRAGCEWLVIQRRPLIFRTVLYFKTHWNFRYCEVTHTDQSWRCSHYFHSSRVSPGSDYWFSFTVRLIPSQSKPATASSSNTSLSVYRSCSSTTTELGAWFNTAVLIYLY